MDSQKNHKIPFKCWLLGHKESKVTDSGFPICERCGAHSYWDMEIWSKGSYFLQKFYLLKIKIGNIRYELDCWYRRIFLKDDLPF